MARTLAFWKYEDGICLNNQEVYEKIADGLLVDGLCKLPVVEILRRVNDVFGDWEKLDESNFEGENGGFTVEAAERSVLFECSFSMLPDDLNKIIDIMLKFDCPLYDPQIETRFDGR